MTPDREAVGRLGLIPDPEVARRLRRWRPINRWLKRGVLWLVVACLTISTAYLIMAGDAAPWFGYAINLAIAFALWSVVMAQRGSAKARYVAAAAAVLIVVGFIGAAT